MHQIKFRIFDKRQEGVMQYDDGHFYITSNGSVWDVNENVDITENTVLMQFTGLKDKNGVEIYEGDYVVMTATSPIGINIAGVVKSDDGCWVIESKKSQAYLYNNFSEIKVVDNIYENPELINQ